MPDAFGGLIPLPVPYAPELCGTRSLRCAAQLCCRICISDAAGSSASFGADAWPIQPVSSLSRTSNLWEVLHRLKRSSEVVFWAAFQRGAQPI